VHRAAATPSRFLFEAQGEAPPEGWVGIEATAAEEGDPPPRAGGAKARPGRGRASGGKLRSRRATAR
jgi:hypothetical protein